MSDHRIERAKERYGVHLTHADISALEASLSVSNRLKAHGHEVVHIVRHAGKAMLVCVREVAGRLIIVTFLPENSFSRDKRKAHRTYRAKFAHRS